MPMLTNIFYEKLTDLELTILETMENNLLDLKEQIDYYQKGTKEHEILCFQFHLTDQIYFSILEDFVKNHKAEEIEID